MSTFDKLCERIMESKQVISDEEIISEGSFDKPVGDYTQEQWDSFPYWKRRSLTRKSESGEPLTRKRGSSYDTPVDGYTDEQWSSFPYWKKRLLTKRAQTGKTAPVPGRRNTDSRLPGVNFENTLSKVETDKVIDYVSMGGSVSKEELSSYIASEFGDKIETDGKISFVINRMIKDELLTIDSNGIISVPDIDEEEFQEPVIDDEPDREVLKRREQTIRDIMKRRGRKVSIEDEEEEESVEEFEDEYAERLNRSGIDWEEDD